MGTYKEGYFHGGSNIHIKLITCKDKVFIQLILQTCVLHWYHSYLLYTQGDKNILAYAL